MEHYELLAGNAMGDHDVRPERFHALDQPDGQSGRDAVRDGQGLMRWRCARTHITDHGAALHRLERVKVTLPPAEEPGDTASGIDTVIYAFRSKRSFAVQDRSALNRLHESYPVGGSHLQDRAGAMLCRVTDQDCTGYVTGLDA